MASLRKRNDKWQAQVRRTGHNARSKSFQNRADAQRWIRQTELELDRLALAYDPSRLERITVADLLTRYRVSDDNDETGLPATPLRATRRVQLGKGGLTSAPVPRANAMGLRKRVRQRFRMSIPHRLGHLGQRHRRGGQQLFRGGNSQCRQ